MTQERTLGSQRAAATGACGCGPISIFNQLLFRML